jgi:hypothetical protein
MSTDLIPSPVPAVLPARLFTRTPKATKLVLEFFTTQIENDHRRKDRHHCIPEKQGHA